MSFRSFLSSRLSDSSRSGRAQALTIDQGQVSFSPLSLSNARCQSTCISLDSLRSDRTLVLSYCLSQVFAPPSIARWQFSPAVKRFTTYGRDLPLTFPRIDDLVLPAENGPLSVNSSCNLYLRNWLSSFLSSLPHPFKHSGYVRSRSFLVFWFRHFFRQVSCISCCYCTVYCSPHRRCVLLNLSLCRHLMLRHDFTALNVRCGRKIFQRGADNLWLIVGSYLYLRLKSYQLLIRFILILCRRLQKQTGRGLYTLFGAAGSETVHSTTASQKNLRRRIGGGTLSKAFSFSQISDHLVPGSTKADKLEDSMFRYVAHVDEVELLTYSSSHFVHTTVPLIELFAFLPLIHARKIAAIHDMSAGSRCSAAQLTMLTADHSCI
jgi:hypothetical protein